MNEQAAVLHDSALFSVKLGNLSAIVDLRRRFDDGELRAAVERLLRVYPILGARFARGFFRDRWRANESALDQVVKIRDDVDRERATMEAVHEPIDVLSTPPLRVTLLRDARGSRLVVNMPHQIVDGSGLLTTLHELAAQLMGVGAATERRMNRTFLQLLRAIPLSRWPSVLAEMVRDSLSFSAVARLEPWAEAFSRVTQGAPLVKRVLLPATTTEAFHRECKARGATINDGLIAVALRMCSRLHEGKRIAAAYTVNMRKFLPSKEPIVGNLSGFLMVATERELGARPLESIARITEATREHKNGLPGLGSNLAPALLFGWLPHAWIRAVGRVIFGGFLALGRRAAVITNVGPMDAYVEPFGELVEDAWISPPTFPDFPAPMSLATTFRGQLSVSVGASAKLASAAVEAVTEEWRQGFEELAGGTRSVEEPRRRAVAG